MSKIQYKELPSFAIHLKDSNVIDCVLVFWVKRNIDYFASILKSNDENIWQICKLDAIDD